MVMEIELFVVSIYMLIFFTDGHHGIDEVQVQIIDIRDVARPTITESYCIDKLNCLAVLGLNVLNS